MSKEVELEDDNKIRKGWQMINEIKERIKTATLNGKEIEKNILKLALSEILSYQMKIGSISAEKTDSILRKLIQSNEEAIKLYKDENRINNLKEEIEVLNSFLPKLWDKSQIVSELRAVVEQIKLAKSEGQAIGVAMKKLKESKAPVNSNDVSDVVKNIRIES
jgi:uncharacterized protein YqeY